MATHFRGTKTQTRALDLLIKLRRASESVARATATVFGQGGLTESQFGVLEALYFLGPLPAGQLSQKILKSAGNLTMVIDNLERLGFVERRTSPGDRRQRPVALTSKGRLVIEKLFPDHVRLVVETMSVLSLAEQETLARLCQKLGRVIDQASLVPHPEKPTP